MPPGQTGARIYAAIDLKSFYASVECIERGLDPLNTNLVVADESRTEKTICLAVSPTLKAYGISGRARLFEVVQRLAQVNARRRLDAPGRTLTGRSWFDDELKADPALEVDYIVAPPRMAHYIARSTEVYNVYLKYIAPEDIHVYSIDEVMIDLTGYLKTYGMTPRQLVKTMIDDVLATTGLTAAGGLGTNLYLCKVAMDIGAKHVAPDADGVRIAELDEASYRRTLWTHRPLTDFWRVGRGYARKLEAHGMCTMGDIARCSIGKPSDYYNEDFLYKTSSTPCSKPIWPAIPPLCWMAACTVGCPRARCAPPCWCCCVWTRIPVWNGCASGNGCATVHAACRAATIMP